MSSSNSVIGPTPPEAEPACPSPEFCADNRTCTGQCVSDSDDADDYDPDEEFLDFECGMMRDGQCTKAGSEECDWDCPRNR